MRAFLSQHVNAIAALMALASLLLVFLVPWFSYVVLALFVLIVALVT